MDSNSSIPKGQIEEGVSKSTSTSPTRPNRHLPGLRGDQSVKACQAQGRIVAHVDLDCFYVQVERSINSDLKNKPVAVVQCKYL